MLKLKGKKKDPGSDLPGTVEEATSGTTGYPGDVRVTALRERRLLMALRGISLGLIISVVLNTVLAFIIVSMLPLKEIRPFLVQIAEEGTLVAAVRPIQDTFEAKDLLTEKLVREYVVNRHEILRSNSVMTSRWSPSGYVGTTTAPDEYRRFRGNAASTIEQIRERDGQRRASITAVNTISAGRIYLVEFTSTFYDQNDKILDQKNYTATIEIGFRQLTNMTREQMMINPTGFTVISYSLAEKDQ
jgi:type IV secretory pathway component VirB8